MSMHVTVLHNYDKAVEVIADEFSHHWIILYIQMINITKHVFYSH